MHSTVDISNGSRYAFSPLILHKIISKMMPRGIFFHLKNREGKRGKGDRDRERKGRGESGRVGVGREEEDHVGQKQNSLFIKRGLMKPSVIKVSFISSSISFPLERL